MNPLCTYWHDHYIEAARVAYPDVCADHELAVGWKLTHPDGTTRHGYYWPLVNGDHDLPVLHQATAWNPKNTDACPGVEGDGLCLIPWDAPVREATSGGASFASGTAHVLVYAYKLSKGKPGKRRVPWVVDVDCFKPLPLTILSGADLSGADLSRADLYKANLYRANLSGADLYGADLYGADLYGANLSRADLYKANLYRANLSGADLSGANLYWADLSGADLSRADLYKANLYRANLSGADLSRADLYKANLYRANLSGANLSGADLSGADLSRADLSGADLSRADLSGADLSGANLYWANYDRGTRWSVGFDPITAGAVKR